MKVLPTETGPARKTHRSGENAPEEAHDVAEDLVAVGLVEDLVARAVVDALLEARALDRLDRRAGVHERHELVVGAMDPQRGQVAERAALGDGGRRRAEALQRLAPE